MFKELFLAIILGALLGFGITGGYLAISKKNQSPNNPAAITTPTAKPDQETSTLENISSQNEEGFSLTGIENLDIVSQENLEINGITTSANNTIIVILNDQITNGTSDQEGKFSLQVKLISGLNNLRIIAIDGNNNQFEKNIYVTYSTATL